jgi:hypothetical protein
VSDLIPIWDFVMGKVPETSAMLHGKQEEINLLKLNPIFDYYAFLDDVEEAYLEAYTDEGWDKWKLIISDMYISRLADNSGATNRTGLDGKQKVDEKQTVIAAYFDCIRAEFFNANIEAYRSFYKENFDWDIDAGRNPFWEYEHSPEQTEAHRRLNFQFDSAGGSDDFISIVVLFSNNVANWKRFRYLFPEEDWLGLQLTKPFGLPAQVLFGEDRDGSNFSWCIQSVCKLTERRMNNLKHVVSLDFAPDAYLLEDPELVVKAPPVYVFSSPVVTTETIERIDVSRKKRLEKLKQLRKRREAQQRKASQQVQTPLIPVIPMYIMPTLPMLRAGGIQPPKRRRGSTSVIPVF